MSARISFRQIGIQGLKRKFALWKALCWLLVWWFPLSFKVFETGCFLRLSRARERPWPDVVWCCHPPLPSNCSGILRHILNVIWLTRRDCLCAHPREEYKSLSFLRVNFVSSAMWIHGTSPFMAISAAALTHLVVVMWSLTGCCHGGSRFTPDHKISSGNSVGILEVRWQTECIWGTSILLPLSFMKPQETGATGLCQRSEYSQCRHSQG